MNIIRKDLRGMITGIMALLFVVAISISSFASTASEIDKSVDKALNRLFQKTPEVRQLAKKAKGILVFPKIYKAGFIVGAQYGEGALKVNGHSVAYYKSVGASYGLQAGAQAFGYALFFMTDDALKYMLNSNGWEIGVGPSIVVVDAGKAKNLTTTTTKKDIYAFIFGQKGLMAGIGLQGTKITPFHPKK